MGIICDCWERTCYSNLPRTPEDKLVIRFADTVCLNNSRSEFNVRRPTISHCSICFIMILAC